jgi:carbon-monoxide dehydrogenase small subunit
MTLGKASAQQLTVSFTLNGKQVETTVAAQVSLIDMLRNDLGLKGAKRSCDMQVCGACTVLVDGKAVSSCTLPAFEVRGREVLTIEGLANGADLHPLMQAFIDKAGFQCGFCTPGMLLAAKSLLDESPKPTEEQVKEYMRGNICRCTGYKKIVESIMDAASQGEKP